MPDNEPTSERNLDGYGAPTIEWARVREVLDGELTQVPGTGGPGRHTLWLTTSNPDGSPHVMPLGVISIDGSWYFSSGPATRKSRNVARDPRCVISVATHAFDLVVEGTAERVVDLTELQTVADAFAVQGWSPKVAGDALTAEFSAPSAGPPPWNVYRVVPSRVFALGTAEPYGATRFDLAPAGHPVAAGEAGTRTETTEDEAQIRSLIERWAQAVHAGDLDRVVADHATDIVMFDVPPPNDGVRGIDAYRETWPPFFEWQRQGAAFEITELDITAGDDVAFAQALLRCGMPAELEEDPTRRLRLSLGLRKENGRWIVTHEHHSFPLA
jgi:uncharacterized protein (TIGR02246 family)